LGWLGLSPMGVLEYGAKIAEAQVVAP
jgi:hypothetical protein